MTRFQPKQSRPRYGKNKTYEHVATHVYCPKCAFHCPSDKMSTMSMHYINVHETKRFICDICDKGFGSKCNYEQHVRNAHNDDKQIKCPECDLTFKSRGNLCHHYGRDHVPITERKRMFKYFTGGDFQCQDCGSMCKKPMLAYHAANCSPQSGLSKNFNPNPHPDNDPLALWIAGLDKEKEDNARLDALIEATEIVDKFINL